MKHRLFFTAAALCLLITTAFAQNAPETAVKRMTDSLKMEGLSAFAIRYPLLRQGAFATDLIGKGHVKSELNGQDLFEGRMNITRIRSYFNIPVSHWGKNTITASLGYQQQHLQITDMKSLDSGFLASDISITKRAVLLSANFSRSDTIFNHLVYYSAGISGLTDEATSIKRINYLASVTVPVSRNQYSSLTLGFVVIIDPSAVSPFIPVISYWHKFKDHDLELFVDIPSRIALRKQLSKRSWTSIGTELGGSILFFDLDKPALPPNAVYSYVELRSGATFEYLVTKKLILGINGGLFTTASPRMFERNKKPDDYFYKSKNGSAPYVSFSVSFLPFTKR